MEKSGKRRSKACHRRVSNAARILTAVTVTAGLVWLFILFLRYRQDVYVTSDQWGTDFDAYIGATARLLAEGTLYQAETLTGPFLHGPYGLYVYSPVLGVGLLPLADMAVPTATAVWYLFRILCLLAACAAMPVKPIVRPFAFLVATLSYSSIVDLGLGNVSVLLLLPLVILWRWLDRPAGSIALALAMSLRPTLGVLLIWQLFRRQRTSLLWTIAAGLVLILLTLPFVGIQGYGDYFLVLRNIRFRGFVYETYNRDLASIVFLFGGGTDMARFAFVAGSLLATASILFSLRRSREVGFMVTLTASLLLSPLLWDHYLALLLLPAAFLADRVRPSFILLPLVSWLPEPMMMFAVVVAMFLPFLAHDADPVPSAVDSPRAW